MRKNLIILLLVSALMAISQKSFSQKSWTFLGYTVEEYIQTSYNKIPSKYGYCWIINNSDLEATKKSFIEDIRSKSGKDHLDNPNHVNTYSWEIDPTTENKLIGIVKFNTIQRTYDLGIKEMYIYMIYIGASKEEIEKKADEYIKEFPDLRKSFTIELLLDGKKELEALNNGKENLVIKKAFND